MNRVMLVCPEPLGTGQPAGVGIRFVEMARLLVADGHRVSALSPDGGGLDGCEAVVTTADTIREVSGRSDAAVVQGHVANEFFANCGVIPTVVDLYDPFIIENLHYFAERGPAVFRHDHATLLTSLRGGDFFLCASAAQRLFYIGLLLALGRVHPDLFADDPELTSLLGVAPFGVPAPSDLPAPPAEPAVLFGGIYDWYDPIAAIDAVVTARASLPALTLTFTTHPNPELTPQGKLAEAVACVRQRRLESAVRFEPWVAYRDRARLFSRHTLALLTFPQSLETDLSMRTRVYDFLWAGLPVISSPAPGTDAIIEGYGVGTIVRDGDYARAIVSALADGERLAGMRASTRSFVADHQWEATLAPLLAFCRAPRLDATKTAFDSSLPPAHLEPTLFDRVRRRLGGRF